MEQRYHPRNMSRNRHNKMQSCNISDINTNGLNSCKYDVHDIAINNSTFWYKVNFNYK